MHWWQHYELWQNDGTEKQDIFEILNVSAFKIGLWLSYAITLLKVINNFVDRGEIVPSSIEVLENRKILIAIERMMAQKKPQTHKES